MPGADSGSKNAVAIRDLSLNAYLIGSEVGRIGSIESTSPASYARMSCMGMIASKSALNLLLQLPLSGFKQPVDSVFSFLVPIVDRFTFYPVEKIEVVSNLLI